MKTRNNMFFKLCTILLTVLVIAFAIPVFTQTAHASDEASWDLNALMIGSEVAVTVTKGGYKPALLLVAVYKADGTLASFERRDVSFSGNTATEYFNLQRPEINNSVKVFLWDKDTHAPLTNALDVEAEISVAVYTRTPIPGNYSSFIANNVHLAYSYDKVNYTPLFNNYGALFAKATFTNNNSIESKCVARPYIFSMADGSFGIIAARVDSNGDDDPTSRGKLLFWQSEDLYHFTEPDVLDLQKDAYIKDVMCISKEGQNFVKWCDEDGNYYENAFHYNNGKATLDAPVETDAFTVDRITSNIDGANEGNAITINGESAETLPRKWAQVENVSVEVPASVTVSSAEELKDLKATATYSDGSTHQKSVVWDMNGINFDVPGTHTVFGTVEQSLYRFPVADNWGDPVIIYRNNKYHYIATNDSNGNIGFEVREADSVEGLFLNNVKKSTILDRVPGRFESQFWAPEFHEINGELYIFFAVTTTANSFSPQAHIMKLKAGGDVLTAEDWEEPIRFLQKDGRSLNTAGVNTPGVNTGGITIDMNYFEVGEQCYVSWSYRTWSPADSGSMIAIASIDKNEPWKLTSDPLLLTRPVYGWENADKTDNNEGSYALVTDDKIYLPYSAANAGGDTYAIGLLTANIGDDLLDSSSWTKSQRPVVSSYSVEGEYGPGHHATFVDEKGDTYIVYHAHNTSGNSTRRVGIRRVHFGVDGSPVFDMSADRDLKEEFKAVQTTVTIKK